MNANVLNKHAISTYHLQQHELVNFLYDRFLVGMVITLIVAAVATLLASYELSLQNREHWVFLWMAGMLAIQYLRFLNKRGYEQIRDEDYFSHQIWKKRFVLGVYLAALWQGLGGVLVMPYISVNLQLIFMAFLLGMGAGAIAYLATSMRIYLGYLILMIMPMAIYLFWIGTPDSMVLSFMLVFMVVCYYLGVRHMHNMIAESLHLRFDNELLVNDLQRLLGAVAQSNKALDKLSTTDELTGASNFRAFRVRLEENRRKHVESKLPLSVAMINIDFYHEYNILYGQQKGDETLIAIAKILMEEIVRQDEIVARVYGAEFGVLLPNVSCEGARAKIERVMQSLRSLEIPNAKSTVSPYLTISAGICCVPVTEDLSNRDLLNRAEEALRQAKHNGRNRIEINND